MPEPRTQTPLQTASNASQSDSRTRDVSLGLVIAVFIMCAMSFGGIARAINTVINPAHPNTSSYLPYHKKQQH